MFDPCGVLRRVAAFAFLLIYIYIYPSPLDNRNNYIWGEGEYARGVDAVQKIRK